MRLSQWILGALAMACVSGVVAPVWASVADEPGKDQAWSGDPVKEPPKEARPELIKLCQKLCGRWVANFELAGGGQQKLQYAWNWAQRGMAVRSVTTQSQDHPLSGIFFRDEAFRFNPQTKEYLYLILDPSGRERFRGTGKFEGEKLVLVGKGLVGTDDNNRVTISFPDPDTENFNVEVERNGSWVQVDNANYKRN